MPKSKSLVSVVFSTLVPPLPPKFPNQISVYSIRYPFFHLFSALISFLGSADAVYTAYIRDLSSLSQFLNRTFFCSARNLHFANQRQRKDFFSSESSSSQLSGNPRVTNIQDLVFQALRHFSSLHVSSYRSTTTGTTGIYRFQPSQHF